MWIYGVTSFEICISCFVMSNKEYSKILWIQVLVKRFDFTILKKSSKLLHVLHAFFILFSKPSLISARLAMFSNGIFLRVYKISFSKSEISVTRWLFFRFSISIE